MTDYTKLKLNPDNPRQIKKEQFEKLKDSIGTFTKMLEIRPIAYDEQGIIWGGNMRYRALKELDIEMKPEYFKELEGYTLEEKREFAIRDNVEFGEYDWDTLANAWDDLPLEDWGINIIWDTKEDKIETEPIKNFKDIKILNLYAGIGGNRKLWGDLDVTAVEYNEQIAEVYADYFPNDEIIIDDAHKYLEDNFDKFDFIWTSPPCPTHSRMRKWGVDSLDYKPIYPDLKLYEEILFLQGYFKGKWVVENVISWYDPLIEPLKIGRHYYWTNFDVENIDRNVGEEKIPKYQDEPTKKEKWGFDLTNYKFDSDYPAQKILNNMVHPEIAKIILETAYKKENKNGI